VRVGDPATFPNRHVVESKKELTGHYVRTESQTGGILRKTRSWQDLLSKEKGTGPVIHRGVFPATTGLRIVGDVEHESDKRRKRVAAKSFIRGPLRQ